MNFKNNLQVLGYVLYQHGYLLNIKGTIEEEKFPYYALELANKYSIVVDKPQYLTRWMLELISDNLGADLILPSFYEHPQDTKFYSGIELEIERAISYFNIELNGGPFSEYPEVFRRLQIFKGGKVKVEENELDKVVRKYRIIISEQEVYDTIRSILKNYFEYTRPWNADELARVESLAIEIDDLLSVSPIKSQNNLCSMVEIVDKKDLAELCKNIFDKDVVAYSINKYKECRNFEIASKDMDNFKAMIENCQSYPDISRKQAKYFNILCKKVGSAKRATNKLSTMPRVVKLIKNREIINAADILKNKGSLLTRHLIWLLSRVETKEEAHIIIDKIPEGNQIVIYQLLSYVVDSLEDARENPRIFKFCRCGIFRKHTETSEEVKKSKSRISKELLDYLKVELKNKLISCYKKKESIGKVFINEKLKRMTLPINTSCSSGEGLGNFPLGTRIKIDDDKNIIAFTRWTEAYDRDISALLFSDGPTKLEIKDFVNYATYGWMKDCYDNAILHSGDFRGKNGSEYIEIEIDRLREEFGIKFVVIGVNAYVADFNVGTTMVGYSAVSSLNAAVWNSSNLSMQATLNSKGVAYFGFAVDTTTREIVVLNQFVDGINKITKNSGQYCIKWLTSNILDYFNLYDVFATRGEIVSTPEEADLVIDDMYTPQENKNQKVVTINNISEIISYI